MLKTFLRFVMKTLFPVEVNGDTIVFSNPKTVGVSCSGIARTLERSPAPVVPMGLSGLWGSVLSRRDGRVLPRPCRVVPSGVFAWPLVSRTSQRSPNPNPCAPMFSLCAVMRLDITRVDSSTHNQALKG